MSKIGAYYLQLVSDDMGDHGNDTNTETGTRRTPRT
jgi:hypothetical protein